MLAWTQVKGLAKPNIGYDDNEYRRKLLLALPNAV